jgi:hypothetical protein
MISSDRKPWFYCTRSGWLASGSNTNRSKPPMRDPRPFAVFISGKFSFTVHARSLEQARHHVITTRRRTGDGGSVSV